MPDANTDSNGNPYPPANFDAYVDSYKDGYKDCYRDSNRNLHATADVNAYSNGYFDAYIHKNGYGDKDTHFDPDALPWAVRDRLGGWLHSFHAELGVVLPVRV